MATSRRNVCQYYFPRCLYQKERSLNQALKSALTCHSKGQHPLPSIAYASQQIVLAFRWSFLSNKYVIGPSSTAKKYTPRPEEEEGKEGRKFEREASDTVLSEQFPPNQYTRSPKNQKRP